LRFRLFPSSLHENVPLESVAPRESVETVMVSKFEPELNSGALESL
jgi:hypothetical protein